MRGIDFCQDSFKAGTHLSATGGCDNTVSTMPMFVREFGSYVLIRLHSNKDLFRKSGVCGIPLTKKPFTRNDESIIYTAEMLLKLPANGAGSIFVSYSSVPNGLSLTFPYSDISRCKRALEIKSISGKIIF